MAYNLCFSPSSLFHDLYPLSNSLPASQKFLKPVNFNHLTKPASLPSHSLQIARVFVQTSISQETHNGDVPAQPNSELSGVKPKRYAWVNPRSRRAKRLDKKSNDSRYNFLTGVAESLQACDSIEDDVFGVLSRYMGNDIVVEHDAAVVLTNLQNLDTMMLALNFFLDNLKTDKEQILYNIVLKACRKRKDFGRAETVFTAMVERGVKPDNITFNTLITCAMSCAWPQKAVDLFEMMPSFNCEPDSLTYSTMIDAYAKAGNSEMALSLYDRARTNNWPIGVTTYGELIRMYGAAGNFDGCSNVYEEMKAIGVKPDMFVYNTMLINMGRANRPWQVKRVLQEMIQNGVSPDRRSYGAVIRAYARARYGNDALAVYKEMKEKGMDLSVLLYNTLLSMCADLGLDVQACEIFEDMKNSGTCKPDSWTYSSMITVYSCSGEVAKAEAMLNEMLEEGLEPTIFVLTSLIQCYGKAKRIDDVVWAYNLLLELGMTPDDRFCGCILSVMTQAPREELTKLIGCIETANPKLYQVVKLLVEGEDGEGKFGEEVDELLASSSAAVKMPFCNCLIDICVILNLRDRAYELLDIGVKLGIYRGLQLRSETQWSLYVKNLSHGAALTAFHAWVKDLSQLLESGEEFPAVLAINTGHGIHRYGDRSLASMFESHFKEVNAPFYEGEDKSGWFLATNIAAKSWLKSGQTSPDLLAV